MKTKDANVLAMILHKKLNIHEEAYGLDIFPNSEKIDGDSSIESVSAHMGRHMIKCFRQYIREAFEEMDDK